MYASLTVRGLIAIAFALAVAFMVVFGVAA
jgi:hypothetical protein